MKKTVIAFILVFAVMLSFSAPYAEEAGQETCRVKWVVRAATFVVSQQTEIMYQVAYTDVPKGHVISIDDLPDVSYDERVINVNDCHVEWVGAVGTEITEDTTFNLQWVANSSDKVAVVWNGYIYSMRGSSVKIKTYEKGHVLTSSDLPAISLDETDDYAFGWGDAEGTELKEDTFFDITCTAKAEDKVAVCYFLPPFMDYIFKDLLSDPGNPYFDYSDYDEDLRGLTEIKLYSKESVIEDMPEVYHMIAPGSYITATPSWENDFNGVKAEENLVNCYVLLPVMYTDVTFMLDENTVFKEYLHYNRSHMLTAPSCEEYAKAAKPGDEYVLATWETNPHVGPFPWNVEPGREFVPLHVPATYYPIVYRYGDVSYDGNVDTRDAVIVLKYCINMWHSTQIYKSVADANKDGSVNTGDAVEILRKIAGIN